ncbi:MAG: hypothetical protein QM765_37710 [Myxococcales bacterium]
MPPPKPPEKQPQPTASRSSNKGTGAAPPRTSTRSAPAAAAPRPPPPPVSDSDSDGSEDFESFEPPDRPTAPVDISGFMEEAQKGPPPPPAMPVRRSKPEMPAAQPRKPTRGELAAAPPAVPNSKPSGNTPIPPRKPTRGEVPAAAVPAPAPAAASPRSSGNTPIPPRKPTKGEVPAAPSKPARPAASPSPDTSDEVTEAAGSKDRLVTTNPQLKTLEAKSRRFALTVVGICALVVGGVAAGAYFVLANDQPEDGDLRLAYPYGFQGKHGPKGEKAPGASEVQFKLVGSVPACGDHTKCLRYQYTGPDGFGGAMLMGKTHDKQWERVGEEGMPFQPAPEEGP